MVVSPGHDEILCPGAAILAPVMFTSQLWVFFRQHTALCVIAVI